MVHHRIQLLILVFVVLATSSFTIADDRPTLRVAVASNFLTTVRQLSQAFEQQTAINVVISSASSGKITTQIEAGAPYDLFLSADEARPQRLVDRGFAIPESLKVYAIGNLVLVSHDPITTPYDFNHQRIAIANPKIAPYGQAANIWLEEHQQQPRLIYGENINQAWHFFQLGAVNKAIIAASQIAHAPKTPFYQLALTTDSKLLSQAMVILKRTNNPKIAQQFHNFIMSDEVQRQIQKSGYRVQ